MKKTNVLIFSEHLQDRTQEDVMKVYPNGIHAVLGSIFESENYNVTYAFQDNVSEVITEEELNKTDVLLWWAHTSHGGIPDDVAHNVVRHIQMGMGFIPLHSAHLSKPMTWILGTSCTLKWRDDSRERIWTTSPYHPIAEGIPEYFELPQEEMYGEHFDIPNAEDIVFMGWFASGELFRSGVTFRRGYGKVFYFQPGHEQYPIYYNETIRKIIKNAVKWAMPDVIRPNLDCTHPEPLETYK